MDMVPESSQAASRKRKASTSADESTDVNEFAPIEEPSHMPRIPGIHVATRTADSAIMFLDPVISVNPETHKKHTREVLGTAKSKSPKKAKANLKLTNPDASATPDGTGDPSTSTKKLGRKKQARIEPAAEETPAKKAPRPRARPVRNKKSAVPGTMVLDLRPSVSGTYSCYHVASRS
jgi:hypothetical protein